MRSSREARREDVHDALALRQPGHLFGRHEILLHDLGAHTFDIDAATVVVDLDVDLAAFVEGAHQDATFARLAGRHALLRCLDAVVNAVAHNVRQRIFDGFNDGLVELGVLAFHLEADFLATHLGQIAHHPRELCPHIADRLHARLHDTLLQLGGDTIEALCRSTDQRVTLLRRVLQDLVAGQDQFAHQIHQAIEQHHIDADVGFADGTALLVPFTLSALLCLRRCRRGRGYQGRGHLVTIAARLDERL